MKFTEEELVKNLKNPIWRISNLYEIRSEKGRIIPFVPNEVQKAVLDEIFNKNHKSLLIPKSRRHGISTLMAIILADEAAFRPGVDVAIVDKTQKDASKKLKIVERAIKSLMKKFPDTWKVSFTSIVIKITREGREESAIYGGKQYRGDTLAAAHISELGTIAASEPTRSTEIIDGTLPSARFGIRVIETTVKGGKKGAFYDMVTEANNTPEEYKSAQDWHVLFFPWWQDPNNADDNDSQLQDTTKAYFTRLRGKIPVQPAIEQMRWWQRIKREHRNRMNQEYPSTLDEAFEVPAEGALFEKALAEAYEQGRICKIPRDPSRPFIGFWDLGAPLNTVSTVIQIVDSRIHILEMACGIEGERPVERTTRTLSKFNALNKNFFPHDSTYNTATGVTQQEMWTTAGLPGIVPIPKTPDVWLGVNHLLSIFPRLYFDEEGTATGRAQLMSYRVKEGSGEIVHDYTSHWADSLRMVAEADLNHLIDTFTLPEAENAVSVSFGSRFSKRNYKIR